MKNGSYSRVDVSNLSKSFLTSRGEKVLVFAGISFVVRCGETLCLLGPSGCGKTTLLKMLALVEQPDAGSIEVHGDDGRARAVVAYMPQGDSLLPWRTVSANVRLGLEIQERSKIQADQRTEELLNRVRLWGERDRYPRELSGGMRRRVALARTLAISSDLLLLDEPLTNLDFVVRQELADYIRAEAVRNGIATVIVTHSIEEAIVLADRIIVLQGRPASIREEFVVARGTSGPERLLQADRQEDTTLYHKIVSSLRGF